MTVLQQCDRSAVIINSRFLHGEAVRVNSRGWPRSGTHGLGWSLGCTA